MQTDRVTKIHYCNTQSPLHITYGALQPVPYLASITGAILEAADP
jgi:hypothetical protein